MTRLRPLALAMLTLALAAIEPAAAQPEGARQPPGPQRRGQRDAREAPDRAEQFPQDREGMRRMIQRRLEQLARDTQRLEQAQKRLEDGESPEKIAADLGPPSGRPGPDGEPGRPGPPPGPEGAGRPFAGISPAEREEIMDAIRKHTPLLARRFEEARADEPGTGQRMLARVLPRIRDALSYRKTDPEMFQLKMQDLQTGFAVFEAAQHYRRAVAHPTEAGPAKIESALTELRAALLAQFDARLAVQVREAELLDARLDSMRKSLNARREIRDTEVDALLGRIKDGSEFRELKPD